LTSTKDDYISKKYISKKNSGLLRVFVYGTLKPGEENYQQYCAGKVLSAKKSYTLGKLFGLKEGYPGMTAGNKPVYGYLLEFADSKILFALDELEDYKPTRQKQENPYNRQEIEIYDLSGQTLGAAWVYLMTQGMAHQLGGFHLPDGWWSGYGISLEQNYEL
jgi:gamma-glutamylcyclotransferase (GGCT)/AIG2-like uncharacterized protein YtfP